MKKLICVSFGLGFLAFQYAFGQLTISCPSGCDAALPNGTSQQYQVTDANFNGCGQLKLQACRFKWEATNGIIDDGTDTNPSIVENDGKWYIWVKWNNVAGDGIIKVTTSNGVSCMSCPAKTTSITIPIKHLGTPGIIKVNGVAKQGTLSVPCGKTPITLSVDPVANATNYSWTLPAGWSGAANSNTIVVTPNTNTQGLIKVTVSRSDVPNLYIASNTITVTRPLPVLTASLPGSNGSALSFCTDVQTVTASATGTNADKFVWTPSGGTKINGATAAQTVSGNVNVTATTDGGYTVKAYSTVCAIASTNSESRTVYYGAATYKNGYYTTNGLTYGLVESDVAPYPNAFCWTGAATQGDAKLELSRVVTKNWIKVTSSPTNFTWALNQWNGVGLTFKALSQNALFQLDYGNNCGITTKSFGFRVISCLQAITVYPNPSVQDILTIQLDNVNDEEVMPRAIELFSDKSTVPVATVSALEAFQNNSFKDGNKLEMNVGSLPRGVYFLHVTHGRMINSEKEKIRLLLE